MPEFTNQTFVIGTAGHIDHGKSTLVKALTGTDPDRLVEEQVRGMTIDLGFAWLETPGGRSVSIVDVPGHERFIKNMLAGVGGIDGALLVIAADEGPMPQTKEHLAILDLIGIDRGIIVVTKTDLVERDWLDLMIEEIREAVRGSSFESARIVPVSAPQGHGLPELLASLDESLSGARARSSHGSPRLPVDRVFTVAGFGTVVTGTLLDGPLRVGDELIIMPGGDATRVRGLQSHSRKVDLINPGTRVAVNLGGVAVEEVCRGDVLARPGALAASHRIDARLNMLRDAAVTLEQNDQVDLFIGSAEISAQVTILDRNEVEPGQSAWVQFRLRGPVAVLRGDRFIIRRPSPSATIGGGEVIDPAPIRHRRFQQGVLDALEVLALGSPEEIVLQMLQSEPLDVRSVKQTAPNGITPEWIDHALRQLVSDGMVQVLGIPATLVNSSFVVSEATYKRIIVEIESALVAFHADNPLRKGMPRENLKSRLRLSGPNRLFDALVATAANCGLIVDEGATLRMTGFEISLDQERDRAAGAFLTAISTNPFSPPGPTDYGVDPETAGALVDLGRLVKIADGIYVLPAAYATIERDVLAMIDRDGSITLAAYRDHFQTSRKYAQATLELLDQRHITRRIGDERVRFSGLGKNGSSEEMP